MLAYFILGVKLLALEAVRIDFRQIVGGDVSSVELILRQDVSQQRNVVLHACKQSSITKKKRACYTCL